MITDEQLSMLRGKLVLHNVSGAPVEMESCGGFTFATDQQIDLLSPSTDPKLQAGNMGIAEYMCSAGPHMELCRLVAEGSLEVLQKVEPMPTAMRLQKMEEWGL